MRTLALALAAVIVCAGCASNAPSGASSSASTPAAAPKSPAQLKRASE